MSVVPQVGAPLLLRSGNSRCSSSYCSVHGWDASRVGGPLLSGRGARSSAADELPILDPVRLVGVGPEAAAAVGLILSVVPHKPHDL